MIASSFGGADGADLGLAGRDLDGLGRPAPTSRKRSTVVAATGGSSWIPSRLSSVTCSFSGTRFSR